MAVAGMAGTAIGVAIAVIRERADRRAIARETHKDAVGPQKRRDESDAIAEEERKIGD
jgi:hypothetical protein